MSIYQPCGGDIFMICERILNGWREVLSLDCSQCNGNTQAYYTRKKLKIQTTMLILDVHCLASFMISKRMYLTLLHGHPKCVWLWHSVFFTSTSWNGKLRSYLKTPREASSFVSFLQSCKSPTNGVWFALVPPPPVMNWEHTWKHWPASNNIKLVQDCTWHTSALAQQRTKREGRAERGFPRAVAIRGGCQWDNLLGSSIVICLAGGHKDWEKFL